METFLAASDIQNWSPAVRDSPREILCMWSALGIDVVILLRASSLVHTAPPGTARMKEASAAFFKGNPGSS